MGKGEIAGNELFLLFAQCFLLNQTTVSPFVYIFDIISIFAAELEEPKMGISGKGLTHYLTLPQTSPGFYLFAVQVFRKHCGKRRNCSSRAISPFATVFSTRIKNFLPFSSNLKLSSANSFTLKFVLWERVNNEIFNCSKLKAFADSILNVTHIL